MKTNATQGKLVVTHGSSSDNDWNKLVFGPAGGGMSIITAALAACRTGGLWKCNKQPVTEPYYLKFGKRR